MQSDPFAHVLLGLASVWAAAQIGRLVALKLRQPPVLGELLAGIVGAQGLALFGLHAAVIVDSLRIFAELGVVLLLFRVGLETDLQAFRRNGARASLIAFVGVITPLCLGFACGWLFAPSGTLAQYLFLGAALSATSVGITARVLKDLGRLDSREAHLILGAAVIDDILGLIVLGLASGLAANGRVDPFAVAKLAASAIAFVGAVLILGPFLARVLARFKHGTPPTLALILCAFLAWASGALGLAALVGAFAAGLILQDKTRLTAAVAPLESAFSPVFFVLMGLQVDIPALIKPDVAALALSLCVAAWLGKLACALVAGPGVRRLAVGLGMIPRGEVGLIFAASGRALGVLTEADFTAVVAMVIVTTLLTPPALKLSLHR